MYNKPVIYVMKPYVIEVGMAFAAGFCVGRYFRQEVPTVAELRQEADAGAEGGPASPQMPPVKRKPMVEYADGKISFNIRR